MEDINFGSGGGGGLFDINFGNNSSANNFGSTINDFGGGLNGGYNDFTGTGMSDFNPGTFTKNSQGLDNYNFGQATMPTFDMNGGNASSLGNMFSQQFGFDQNLGGAATDVPSNYESGTEGWGLGGIGDYLGKMLKNPQMMTGILGALFEGRQNKNQASQNKSIVEQQQALQQLQRQQAIQRQDQQQQVVSPYDRASAAAGGDSMRNAIQQQLMNSIQNPYEVPIVKQQVDAMTQAQRRKDAVAGRRSNNATSDPQLLAEQAKIAQNYMNSMQGPAGATINPSYPGLNNNTDVYGALQALLQGSSYNTNGVISPLMSALGFGQTR